MKAFLMPRPDISKAKSLFVKILRTLLAFWMILLSPVCLAATDDIEFDACRGLLKQDADVLPGQIWYKPPADAAIENVVRPEIKFDGPILRWTFLVNEDGSKTLVVMTRDTNGPQLQSDPDGFDVFMEMKGVFYEKDGVAADSFAFSAYETDHVNGFFFCRNGVISPEWDWDGENWSP
jgi:hypothetical protein